MIEFGATLIVGIAVFTEILLIVFWLVNFKSSGTSIKNLPKVDILIAARNEGANICNCLEALLALNYPKNKLSIWVGDDASTDSTWQLIEKYASIHDHITGLKITEKITNGNGKANVLAQLAKKCNGEWIFITDADIKVPTQWVQAMLAGAEQAVLVTGTSIVEGKSLLAKIQRLDWLYATAMLKIVSDVGIPATTIGNNMAITRSVYEKIGGFENVPFSVTEDLEIFKLVKEKHKTINLFSAELLNKSVPQNSILQLLVQRKRWMRGAFELPFQLLGILLIQAIYFSAIIILIILNPLAGFYFWLAKWLIKYSFLALSAKKLNENVSIFSSFVAELFSMLFSMASVIYYFWPGKIHWKGRTY